MIMDGDYVNESKEMFNMFFQLTIAFHEYASCTRIFELLLIRELQSLSIIASWGIYKFTDQISCW